MLVMTLFNTAVVGDVSQSSNRMMQRQRALYCLIVFILLSLLAVDSSAEIYQYRDANGKTVFTDSPPPSAEELEEIKPTINTAIPASQGAGGGDKDQDAEARASAERKAKREEAIKERNKRSAEKKTLRDELKEELRVARDRLEELKDKRKLAETPLPGERQHSVISGNSRLKESYFKRLAELDRQIEEAEEAVAAAKENLRKMKRQPKEESEQKKSK